jgi:peptidoglycan/LPS O-acetylase OafA/YrhL
MPAAETVTSTGRTAERIVELDGVRALAVLGVIASHSGFIGLGWIGVDVFFGLSGYLITGILLDARACAPTAREFFVPFYMRRALRILPLAWTVVLLVAAIRGQWGGVGWYLGYLVNWLPATPEPTDLGHFWSLAVEEQFYTIWPALVFLVSVPTLLRLSVGLIAFDVLFRLVLSVWHPVFATDQFLGLATFSRADTLAVGAILAIWQRTGGFGRAARWAPVTGLACAVGLVALRVLERRNLVPLLTYNAKWPVLAAGVGAALIYTLVERPALLRWRALVWIGQVSYGVYVIHALFGHWLHARFSLAQAPLIFLLQTAITLPLAGLSWYLFERPILSQKWRWPMPVPPPVRAGP